jgi:hypothetical protein
MSDELLLELALVDVLVAVEEAMGVIMAVS